MTLRITGIPHVCTTFETLVQGRATAGKITGRRHPRNAEAATAESDKDWSILSVAY